MKKTLILAVACALVSGAALAVWNAQDNVPAASLLVPYAVVSTTSSNAVDPSGYTTLFAITNVSYSPIIVHLTVWTALSKPVVDWDVFLTGYDVWTINFADLLNGRFDRFDTDGWTTTLRNSSNPPTGYTWTPFGYGPSSNLVSTTLPTSGYWSKTTSAALPDLYYRRANNANPAGAAVPFYPYSSGCLMPYGDLSSLGSTIRRNIRLGEPSIDLQYYYCKSSAGVNGTWTANLATAPLFFYVTADVVNFCSTTFQTVDSYWTNVTNADQNVIMGDILYFNPTSNYSEMIAAVHLEALPGAGGLVNFYELDFLDSRVCGNAAATNDDREPLGNRYGFRYATSPAAVQTEILVWKNMYEAYFLNFGTEAVPDEYWTAIACGPYRYYAWNEDELTKSLSVGPSGFSVLQPNAIPFETQAVPVNLTNFPGLVTIKTVGSQFTGGEGYGWVDLFFDGAEGVDGRFDCNTAEIRYEAWVAVRFIFGTYSAAQEATLLNNPYNQGMGGVGATVVPGIFKAR
jgi:hypothetical protein